jgi:glycerophosphoryl diester phosphodiesterase
VSSPWLERRVIAFAHQAGAFEGPSCTLHAIGHALGRGATAVELDVHASLDRHLVVCHDATVERTTNHAGSISQLTLDELGEMDNAYWWAPGAIAAHDRDPADYPHRGKAPADRHFGVATLAEVVREFPGVLLNLDIKGTAPHVEPYERLLADELERLGASETVIVASFHDEAIRSFRAAAPHVATSAATGEVAAFYFSLQDGSRPEVAPVCAFQVPAHYGDVTLVDERFVAAAHQAGVAVHVWTINDAAEMSRLLDLGVDGIMTDTPTALAELLARRGCAWDGNR